MLVKPAKLKIQSAKLQRSSYYHVYLIPGSQIVPVHLITPTD